MIKIIMERILQNIRPNWKTKLNNLGFYFHSTDQNGNLVDDEEKRFIYWREDVAYKFSEKEIINLKQSTQEVHLMCLHMLDEIIKKVYHQITDNRLVLIDKTIPNFMVNQ